MTGVVIDLGCCFHNGEGSTERLIERHKPNVYWGFDPLLPEDADYQENGTTIRLRRKAAWTEDGSGPLGTGGHTLLNATLLPDKDDQGEWLASREVELFDFGAWFASLDETAILKLNVEGAEFPLLEDIVQRGLDTRIELLYVSWHDHRMGDRYADWRYRLERLLRCPTEPWTLW